MTNISKARLQFVILALDVLRLFEFYLNFSCEGSWTVICKTNAFVKMLQEPKECPTDRESMLPSKATKTINTSEFCNAPKNFNNETAPFFNDDDMLCNSPSSGGSGNSSERMDISYTFNETQKTPFFEMPVLSAQPPKIVSDGGRYSGWPHKNFSDFRTSIAVDCAYTEQDPVTENRRLWNIGNSCYMNATLQSLSTCTLFLSQVNELNLKISENEVMIRETIPVLLCDELSYLLEHLSHRDTGEHNVQGYLDKLPPTVLARCRSLFGKLHEDFYNFGQQDAHEYLILILGFFDDVVKSFVQLPPRSTIQFPLPNLLFTSKIETRFTCSRCNYVDFKVEERSDLMLFVRPEASIQSLLSSVFTSSTIERRCSKCEWKSCLSGNRIVDFPHYLVIHMQRYEYSTFFNASVKRPCTVFPSPQLDATVLASYSEDLECSQNPPYVSNPYHGGVSQRIALLNGGNAATKSTLETSLFNANEKVSPYFINRKRQRSGNDYTEMAAKRMKTFFLGERMQTRSTEKKPVVPVKYTLTAAVCHRGNTPHSGHYVAYTKDAQTGEWYHCSDSEVTNVGERAMMNEVGRDGYVLYYTRINN